MTSLVQIDDEMILPILRDIVHGMSFLHAAANPTIHGDLKTQNVLVDSKLRAKVADFGLTQKRQVVEHNGMAWGSPFSAPPERLRGEPASCAGDVYAFGVLLFEVVTRKEPYEGMLTREVLDKVRNAAAMPGGVPMRPTLYVEVAEPQLRVLMEQCWTEKPSERPTFAALDPLVQGIESTSLGRSRSARQNRATSMLEQLFPKHVADALVQNRKVRPLILLAG